MYVNARASHTVQPILSHLLKQSKLVTIMHQREPAFVLINWSVYTTLRSLLTQHGYVDPQLMETRMIGISHMARRFLSFEKIVDTFHTERGTCAIVFVLKRNDAVGALIRYDYYISLIAFLQERQVDGMSPFLTEATDGPILQNRLLSLVAFRNSSMQLPFYFTQEQHLQGGDLPFIVTVTREHQPALVIFSWEIWKRLLHLFTVTDHSQEDRELITRLLMQIQETRQDEDGASPSPNHSSCS